MLNLYDNTKTPEEKGFESKNKCEFEIILYADSLRVTELRKITVQKHITMQLEYEFQFQLYRHTHIHTNIHTRV